MPRFIGLILEDEGVIALTPVRKRGLSGEQVRSPFIRYRDINESSFFSPVNSLQAPSLTTITYGNNSITLSWTDPAQTGGSITSYNVYRSTTPGGEALLVSAGLVNTYTDFSVINNIPYYYTITAVNSFGEGPQSNELFATAFGDIVNMTQMVAA